MLLRQILARPYPHTFCCEFSSDATKLYVNTNRDTSYLYQYDLNATNITASKDTIWIFNYPPSACGALELAPDNKIYLSNWFYDGLNNPYPYEDTVYNSYNMNLGVINSPDSSGIACDFQPYSFYLGGKRTYLGLPNNPNYDMPALASLCDTLISIYELVPTILIPQLQIYFHPNGKPHS